MKKTLILLSLVLLSISNSLVAFAEPDFYSISNQTFDQNDPVSEIDKLYVEEDGTGGNITAEHGIRIIIPEEMSMIFDYDKTMAEIYLEGSGLNNGRVLENPEISFEDGQKTLYIPVLENFEGNEYIAISKIYLRGFHNQAEGYLELKYNSEILNIADKKYIRIREVADLDRTPPTKPANVVITQESDTSALLTWEGPADLDLDYIEVYRELNEESLTLEAYIEFEAGIQEFLDENLKINDIVNYRLIAVDISGNFITDPDIYQYTMIDMEEITTVADTTEDTTVEGEDTAADTTETAVEGEDTATEDATDADATEADAEDTLATPELSDIATHWAKEKIEDLVMLNIVKGDDDADTFRPSGNLNRAEAAAFLYRVLGVEAPEVTEKPFPDVELDAWYTNSVVLLNELELIDGNDEGMFEPEEKINRAEFLTMAMNVYYYLATTEEKAEIDALKEGAMTDVYEDLADVWYSGTVTAATELGFVSGKECGNYMCFEARAQITRAEATTMLHSMFYDILTGLHPDPEAPQDSVEADLDAVNFEDDTTADPADSMEADLDAVNFGE